MALKPSDRYGWACALADDIERWLAVEPTAAYHEPWRAGMRQRVSTAGVVLQLGWQCGQPFANQWEFVEWAQQHRPDLDLTSPPTRP